MKQPSKRGWMLCFCLVAALLILVVCLGRRIAPLTIGNVTDLSRADILKQTPVDLELTIDLSALPADWDMRNHHQNLDIPVYQTDTTTIRLQSISYANEGDDSLYVDFDFCYDLPDQGEVILPYIVVINGDELSHSGAVGKGHLSYRTAVWVDKMVRDDAGTIENAASLRGYGPGEKFTYYLNTAVFQSAQGTITFHGRGFNCVKYAKR